MDQRNNKVNTFHKICPLHEQVVCSACARNVAGTVYVSRSDRGIEFLHCVPSIRALAGGHACI